MLVWFLALYTEEMSQCTFQQKRKHLKSWYTLQTFLPQVLRLMDKNTTAILQDIQFHPVSDRILHVDFYQLFDDKEVTMNIPVKLTRNFSRSIKWWLFTFYKP